MSRSASAASKRVRNSTLKVYAGGSHGICSTQADRVNADLLEFIASIGHNRADT